MQIRLAGLSALYDVDFTSHNEQSLRSDSKMNIGKGRGKKRRLLILNQEPR
jgi:hypothetical protein